MLEVIQGVLINQLFQFVFRQHADFLDFMRRAEAVEEVHKGNVPLNRRQMSHCRQIGAFLHAGAAQHGPARIAAAHDVGMVAENRHGMSPDRTGRHVEDDGLQFAR